MREKQPAFNNTQPFVRAHRFHVYRCNCNRVKEVNNAGQQVNRKGKLSYAKPYELSKRRLRMLTFAQYTLRFARFFSFSFFLSELKEP